MRVPTDSPKPWPGATYRAGKGNHLKDIFEVSGLSSSVRKDGYVDVKVHLVTQVSPATAGTLLEKLTPYAHRFCIVKIEKQQAEINTETGEVV